MKNISNTATQSAMKRSALKFYTPALVLLFLTPLVHSLKVEAYPFPKELIAEKTLESSQEQVVFEDVKNQSPSDSRHLFVQFYAGHAGDDDLSAQLHMRFNGDSLSNYTNRTLYAEGDNLDTEVQDASLAANIMKIPAAGNRQHGFGQSFLPWAFLNNQNKHVLTQGSTSKDYLSMNMSHWQSREPVSSIQLELKDNYSFAAGSSFRLYAINENYQLKEKVLSEDREEIGLLNLSQSFKDLILVGQTRSNDENPQRRGDRVWYSINGDNQGERYQVQRLTGEAGYYDSDDDTERNRILLNQMNEPRVGWNTAKTAPQGTFGPWLLYYPEYTNTDMWRTFLSRHGTHDGYYDPVGNEIGRWTDSASIKDLRFFPQRGEDFKKGSRIGVYRSKEPVERYSLKKGDAEAVTIDFNQSVNSNDLQLHVAASSRYTGSDEDQLLIEFNDDDVSGNYVRQKATGFDRDDKASSKNDNEIGVLPSGDIPAQLMSNTHMHISGVNDGNKNVALLSYGGVPGDGRIATYGSRWQQPDNVERITLRTKSGEPFAKGSVFAVWSDDKSVDSDIKIIAAYTKSNIIWWSALLTLVLFVAAMIYNRKARKGTA